MGSYRLIKYGSISGGDNASGEVTSNADTFGDLKAEETTIGALASGMSALAKVEGKPNVKLTSDSQTLPEGPFTLYFVMDKNASGKWKQGQLKK